MSEGQEVPVSRKKNSEFLEQVFHLYFQPKSPADSRWFLILNMVNDDNTDVIVKMKNGDVYLASFFSYDEIERLRKIHLKNKQFLNGSYFWVKGMILIKDVTT